MKTAIVGVTGLVGTKMLQVLEERDFPLTELIPVASEQSVGKEVIFKRKPYPIVSLEQAIALQPALCLFAAGSNISKLYAPRFAAVGATVVDNSAEWRMDPSKKLVVPEVNAAALEPSDKIIANPNCSTIQMVLVLKPLHDHYRVKRVVVATYQSVTGTGAKGLQQLMNERQNRDAPKVYPHQIDLNIIPHIDAFQENAYTKEEMKMVQETQKIMNDTSIKVTATAARVPVIGGHSEAINIELAQAFDLAHINTILEHAPGVQVIDVTSKNQYPMPIDAHEKDTVFVGRIRRDESQLNTLNCWVVADNLRKGAATNAVQIAEYLLKKGFI